MIDESKPHRKKPPGERPHRYEDGYTRPDGAVYSQWFDKFMCRLPGCAKASMHRTGGLCSKHAGGDPKIGTGGAPLAHARVEARELVSRMAARWPALMQPAVDVSIREQTIQLVARSKAMCDLLDAMIGDKFNADVAAGGSGEAALVVDTQAGSPVGVVKTGEQMSALYQVRMVEQKAYQDVLRVAHQMGIDERRVAIAEQSQTLVVDALMDVLASLNLAPDVVATAQLMLADRLEAGA